MSLNNKLLAGFATTSLMFLMSGCAINGKVTGGGWLEGVEGGKANYGFNAAACTDVFDPTGRLNYRDKNADVAISAEIDEAVECTLNPDDDTGLYCLGCWLDSADVVAEACGGRWYTTTFDYRSTNKNAGEGEGTGYACMVDCGEGANAAGADWVLIRLDSGPFAGYVNSGEPGGGNIQAHDCTCTDGVDNDGDGLTDADDPDCVDPNADEDTPQI